MRTFCNATQPNITQCFGYLGGTVEVLLLINTSHVGSYKLKKNDIELISSIRGTNHSRRHSFNVSTGIFTITDIKEIDNGPYSLDVHDTEGKEKANIKCYLTIQGE